MSIVVEDLTFAYEMTPVLDSIGLEARPGRVTVLLGPNAAGKSTLLRCIMGALRPQSGRVLIDGRPAHRVPPRELAGRVAYVPQRSQVAAAFTARDVIRLGRYALAPEPERVSAAIDRLDLGAEASRAFAALSVGQQQRVVLARALAQLTGDGHLVLDEPMAAMDLRHVRETLGLLREIAAGGATVILAMHDVTSAARVADDAWLLDAGRVVAAGAADDVLAPDRLEAVFGVPFTLVAQDGVRPALVPRILPDR